MRKPKGESDHAARSRARPQQLVGRVVPGLPRTCGSGPLPVCRGYSLKWLSRSGRPTLPGLGTRPGQGCSHLVLPGSLLRPTGSPVSRATDACSTYAGAAARSELSERPQIAQVRGTCCRQHVSLGPPGGQWDPWPPEPHFLLLLCQVTDCFLKPNWRSLWPGRGPGSFPEVVGGALA